MYLSNAESTEHHTLSADISVNKTANIKQKDKLLSHFQHVPQYNCCINGHNINSYIPFITETIAAMVAGISASIGRSLQVL